MTTVNSKSNPLICIMTVDIGDGRSGNVEIRANDDCEDLGRTFLQTFDLPEEFFHHVLQNIQVNRDEAAKRYAEQLKAKEARKAVAAAKAARDANIETSAAAEFSSFKEEVSVRVTDPSPRESSSSRRMTGSEEELELQYAAIQQAAKAFSGKSINTNHNSHTHDARRLSNSSSGASSVATALTTATTRSSFSSSNDNDNTNNNQFDSHLQQGIVAISARRRISDTKSVTSTVEASSSTSSSSSSYAPVVPPVVPGAPSSISVGHSLRPPTAAQASPPLPPPAATTTSIAPRIPRVALLPPKNHQRNKPVIPPSSQHNNQTAVHTVAPFNRLYKEADEKKARNEALIQRAHNKEKIAEGKSRGSFGSHTNNNNNDGTATTPVELRLYQEGLEALARKEAHLASLREKLGENAILTAWMCSHCGTNNKAEAAICMNPVKFGYVKQHQQQQQANAANVCGAPRPRVLGTSHPTSEPPPQQQQQRSGDVQTTSSNRSLQTQLAHVDAQIEEYQRERVRRAEAAKAVEAAALSVATFKPLINPKSVALAAAVRERKQQKQSNKEKQREEQQQQQQQPTSSASVHVALYEEAIQRNQAAVEAAAKPAPWHGCTFFPNLQKETHPEGGNRGESQGEDDNNNAGEDAGEASEQFEGMSKNDDHSSLASNYQKKQAKYFTAVDMRVQRTEEEQKAIAMRLHRYGGAARETTFETKRAQEEAAARAAEASAAAEAQRRRRGLSHIGPTLYDAAMKAAGRRAARASAAAFAAEAAAGSRHTLEKSEKMLSEMRFRAFSGIFRVLVASMEVLPAARVAKELAEQETSGQSSSSSSSSSSNSTSTQGRSFSRDELVAIVAALDAYSESLQFEKPLLSSSAKQGGATTASAVGGEETVAAKGVSDGDVHEMLLDIDAVWVASLAQPQLESIIKYGLQKLRHQLDIIFQKEYQQQQQSSSTGEGTTSYSVGSYKEEEEDDSKYLYVKNENDDDDANNHSINANSESENTLLAITAPPRLVTFVEFATIMGKILEKVAGGPFVYMLGKQERKEASRRAALRAAAEAEIPTFAPELDPHSMEIIAARRNAPDNFNNKSSSSSSSSSFAAGNAAILAAREKRELDYLRQQLALHPFDPFAINQHASADPKLKQQLASRREHEQLAAAARAAMRSDVFLSRAGVKPSIVTTSTAATTTTTAPSSGNSSLTSSPTRVALSLKPDLVAATAATAAACVSNEIAVTLPPRDELKEENETPSSGMMVPAQQQHITTITTVVPTSTAHTTNATTSSTTHNMLNYYYGNTSSSPPSFIGSNAIFARMNGHGEGIISSTDVTDTYVPPPPAQQQQQQYKQQQQAMFLSPTRFVAHHLEDYGYTPLRPNHHGASSSTTGAAPQTAGETSTQGSHQNSSEFDDVENDSASLTLSAMTSGKKSVGSSKLDDVENAVSRSGGVVTTPSLITTITATSDLEKSTILMQKLSSISIAALGARIDKLLTSSSSSGFTSNANNGTSMSASSFSSSFSSATKIMVPPPPQETTTNNTHAAVGGDSGM